MQRTDLGLIDPRNLTVEQEVVLLEYFRSQKQSTVLEKNKLYDFSLGAENFTFEFSHEILVREREHHKGEFRFEIISNDPPLGEGSFGKVVAIEGRLIEEDGRLIYNAEKERVVKIQFHADMGGILKAISEAMLTASVDHVHIKTTILTKIKGQSFSYTVMRRLKDFTGDEIIEKNVSITTDEFIEVSILLFLALEEQIDLNNIVHRDIKPGNAMLSKNFKEVKIFDFGLSASKDIAVNSKDIVGSPLYISPEVYAGQGSSILSDVYGLTIAIAEMLDVKILRDDFPTNNDLRIHAALPPIDLDRQKYRNKEFFKDLTDEQFNQIFILFEEGTKADPKDRPSPQSCALVFENIRLARKFVAENISQAPVKTEMIKANKAARKLRLNLIKNRKALNNSNDFAKTFEQTKGIIIEALKKFDNSNVKACDEFIARSGISAFAGLADGKAIEDRLKEINTTSIKSFENLLKLKSFLEKMLFTDLLVDKEKEQIRKRCILIDRVLAKFSKKASNIDELVALNNRVEIVLSKGIGLIVDFYVKDLPKTQKGREIINELESIVKITLAELFENRAASSNALIIEQLNAAKEIIILKTALIRMINSECERLKSHNKVESNKAVDILFSFSKKLERAKSIEELKNITEHDPETYYVPSNAYFVRFWKPENHFPNHALTSFRGILADFRQNYLPQHVGQEINQDLRSNFGP